MYKRQDHGWIGFRHPDTRTSESLCVYFEIDPDGYGYGMGMYDANPALMKPFRARVLADPERFLAILADPRLEMCIRDRNISVSTLAARL